MSSMAFDAAPEQAEISSCRREAARATVDLNFAVVILATGAGGSGRPKQLLPYLGRTLVEHAARTALASGAREVVVVGGEHTDEIRRELRSLPVRVVANREWKDGLAGSIRSGVLSLRQKVDSVVLALCDQPRITPGLLRDLAERAETGDCPIAASSYDGILGAPAAFSRALLPELLSLTGKRGAQDLIRSGSHAVATVLFSAGNVRAEEPAPHRLIPPVAKVAFAPFRRTRRIPMRGPPSSGEALRAKRAGFS